MSHKIYIVDDDEGIRNIYERFFEYIEGDYETKSFEDGEGILNYLNEGGRVPDLVVSDIDMKCVDGLSLCRILKKNEATSQVKIILNSGKDRAKESREAEADAFLDKPVTIDGLGSKVRELLYDK
jgi:DNA-binding NtrC family response regulator